MNNFDYKVKRNEDCILIDIDNWLQNEEQLISIQKISGRLTPTCITEVLDLYIKSPQWEGCPLQKGDKVLISQVATDVAPFRNFKIENNDRYCNVPFTQVMGTFNNNTLTMLYDKVLIKKEEVQISSLTMKSNMMVGKVVKVGTNSFDKKGNSVPLQVKIGDRVLVTDNVSTEVTLNHEKYYAVEERMIVGIFKNDLSIENMTLINKSILLKPYIATHVLNSTLLVAPAINYDDLDYSDINNRDLFKIYYIDKNLSKLQKNDIVLLRRDYTNYVYYGQEKFHILNGYEYISAKINEKEK